ncbi:hypothetical protein [Acidithiobacillus sp.]|uniref:hypothetical protein n=1 Tax=Acidithiobacillus sp. TaxID=1872118 RepID=UPI0025B8843D|nr:hypothetical protein [Acidithiobacillus sp.]
MLQIVLLILGLLTVSVGLYEKNHFWFEQSQAQNMAQETAAAWNGFAQGLNAYVKQNMGTITGSETVSCQTLQSAGYYSGSCTDPLGETMEGVVAAPYGFPQSWGVIATSAPNPAILGKFGIGNPDNPVDQSLKWHAFTYDVATILQGDNLTAAIYNGGSQAFKMPFGTAASTYADYSLPATPTTYGQTSNGIGPDGLMAFPQLHKQPGYWLWQAQLLDENSEANISFVNYGYSAVCPPGGVTPVSWNSSWVENNGSGTATYFDWGHDTSLPGMFMSMVDPSNPFNYQQVFVCVPAPQALVNNSTSYNPFYSANNNAAQNVVNPSYSSQYWNGDAQTAVQAGELYTISVGSQIYSLVTYAGWAGAGSPGVGSTQRVDELAFYLGNPSGAGRVAPSPFGDPQWNNTGGFYAPPVVTLSSQSLSLN